MTNEEILNIELVGRPCGAKTIREAFVFIAEEVWKEGEGFSGKRALGYSGWQRYIYLSLAKAGAIEGSLDEYGDLDECDYDATDKLVSDAIMHMASERRPDPKRKMVLIPIVGDNQYAAFSAEDVSALLPARTPQPSVDVYMRGSNAGEAYRVLGTIADVAERLGIELVEPCTKI